MRILLAMIGTLMPAAAFATAASQALHERPQLSLPIELVQRGRSCKTVSSCREAVQMWCDGYTRADGDGDGIPCENVCPNRELVDRIREEIGC